MVHFKSSRAIKFISWISPWNVKQILKFFMSLKIFYYKNTFWIFFIALGYSISFYFRPMLKQLTDVSFKMIPPYQLSFWKSSFSF